MNSAIAGLEALLMNHVHSKTVPAGHLSVLMIGQYMHLEDLDARYSVFQLNQVSSGAPFATPTVSSMLGKLSIQFRRK